MSASHMSATNQFLKNRLGGGGGLNSSFQYSTKKLNDRLPGYKFNNLE